MKLVSQKFKYDCGVAAVYNLLKIENINYDYFNLKKDLNTTKSWGTFPIDIEDFLKKLKINKFKIGIILISSDKFYKNKKDKVDYGHYLNVIGLKNNKYQIFDPWDGRNHRVKKEKLKKIMKNVLVGKKNRFNNIYFGNLKI